MRWLWTPGPTVLQPVWELLYYNKPWFSRAFSSPQSLTARISFIHSLRVLGGSHKENGREDKEEKAHKTSTLRRSFLMWIQLMEYTQAVLWRKNDHFKH